MRKLLKGNFGALADSDRKIVFEIVKDLTINEDLFITGGEDPGCYILDEGIGHAYKCNIWTIK